MHALRTLLHRPTQMPAQSAVAERQAVLPTSIDDDTMEDQARRMSRIFRATRRQEREAQRARSA
jgi:hypothetical protein